MTGSEELLSSFSTLLTFEIAKRRLNYLEAWRELAIRPERDGCQDVDLDLLENEPDDYRELEKRCIAARENMNILLPHPALILDDYLEVRTSTIPEAGLGLFYFPADSSPILKGDAICYYWGDVHSFLSVKKLKECSYLMLLEGDTLVDASTRLFVKARFINDPLNETFVNCKFLPEQGKWRSRLVSVRDIQPGEELFVSYGESYWANKKHIVPRIMKSI